MRNFVDCKRKGNCTRGVGGVVRTVHPRHIRGVGKRYRKIIDAGNGCRSSYDVSLVDCVVLLIARVRFAEYVFYGKPRRVVVTRKFKRVCVVGVVCCSGIRIPHIIAYEIAAVKSAYYIFDKQRMRTHIVVDFKVARFDSFVYHCVIETERGIIQRHLVYFQRKRNSFVVGVFPPRVFKVFDFESDYITVGVCSLEEIITSVVTVGFRRVCNADITVVFRSGFRSARYSDVFHNTFVVFENFHLADSLASVVFKVESIRLGCACNVCFACRLFDVRRRKSEFFNYKSYVNAVACIVRPHCVARKRKPDNISTRVGCAESEQTVIVAVVHHIAVNFACRIVVGFVIGSGKRTVCNGHRHPSVVVVFPEVAYLNKLFGIVVSYRLFPTYNALFAFGRRHVNYGFCNLNGLYDKIEVKRRHTSARILPFHIVGIAQIYRNRISAYGRGRADKQSAVVRHDCVHSSGILQSIGHKRVVVKL